MMKTWSLMLVLLLAGPLNAQTVWRCGPDGKTYSDRPCTDGSTLDHADKRSDAEVRAARWRASARSSDGRACRASTTRPSLHGVDE